MPQFIQQLQIHQIQIIRIIQASRQVLFIPGLIISQQINIIRIIIRRRIHEVAYHHLPWQRIRIKVVRARIRRQVLLCKHIIISIVLVVCHSIDIVVLQKRHRILIQLVLVMGINNFNKIAGRCLHIYYHHKLRWYIVIMFRWVRYLFDPEMY